MELIKSVLGAWLAIVGLALVFLVYGAPLWFALWLIWQ